MKRQSVRVELFPLKKEEILAYLDDKGVLVNDYFKTYLAHPAYQAVKEQQECLVEIISLADMGFAREATAPQIEERAVEMGHQLPPAHLGVYLRLALLEQEVSQDAILSQGKSPDGAICLLSPQLEREFTFPRSVYLGVDAITGKKVKTSVTGRTKTEVKQKAKHAPIEFAKNGSTVKKEVEVKTYQELADLWLESYKLTVKPQTFVVTKRQLYNHLIPIFGGMKLDKIVPAAIQQFVNGLAPKLVNFKAIHSINNRILQHGVLLQVLATNPARDVILPKKQKKGREAVRFIEPEHLKQFLDHAEQLASTNFSKYYQYVIFKLLLATGCRIGELSALEWSDIDLEAGTISISKTYSMELHIIGTTKTKAGTRIISIDKKTALLLKQYRNRQRLMFLEVGACTPDVVFATTVREYLPRISLQEIINRRCKALGIPRFTCHAFRHTHASLLLNAGISYKELQYRLGHSNISMTLDTYGHLSKDKEKEAVSYYEKAINSL